MPMEHADGDDDDDDVVDVNVMEVRRAATASVTQNNRCDDGGQHSDAIRSDYYPQVFFFWRDGPVAVNKL